MGETVMAALSGIALESARRKSAKTLDQRVFASLLVRRLYRLGLGQDKPAIIIDRPERIINDLPGIAVRI